MKKLKILGLALLILFGVGFLSACEQKQTEQVLCESIVLSENEIVLMPNERMEIGVSIYPENATNKNLEIVGDYADIAHIEFDANSMKLIVTAREFITAGKVNTTIGLRAKDESMAESHLEIELSEQSQQASVPADFSFDGTRFNWRVVDGAKSYTIQIDDENFTINQNFYTLDVDKYAGKTITARLRANGKSSNLNSQFSYSISLYCLERPTDVEFNAQTGILSWNGVQNSKSYNVFVNGREYQVAGEEFNIDAELKLAGQYEIKVAALGDLNDLIINSVYSNSLILTRLSSPNDPSIQNGMAFWNAVVGAVGYDIEYTYSKNGVEETRTERVTSTRFVLPQDIDAGSYKFKVCSVGNGLKTLTSDYGIERSFYKLGKVQNLRVENGVIVWNSVPSATTYTVYFENLVSESGEAVTDFISQSSNSNVEYPILEHDAGEYKIDVVANGGDDKISSQKTGNPITVVKLATPKNLQLVKQNSQILLQWDTVLGCNGYKVVINEDEGLSIPVQNVLTEKVTLPIDKSDFRIGSNTVKVMSVCGEFDGRAYQVNSDYTTDLTITKLASPTFNFSDVLNGNISWSSTNSKGFESYTFKILSPSGTLVYSADIVKNKFNLNCTAGASVDTYDLPAGDYKVTVNVNASNNANFISSDFSDEVQIHKFDIETLYAENGTVKDFEQNEEENYKYRYYSSLLLSPMDSINDYVEHYVKSGSTFTATAQKIAVNTFKDNVYYISSNLSNSLLLKKLPTISDLTLYNSVLHYGKDYTELNGFKFLIIIDEKEPIDNGTNVVYEFGDELKNGSHTIRVKAVSAQEGAGVSVDGQNPLYLNSYEANTPFNIKKLNAPQTLKISGYSTTNAQSVSSFINKLNSYSQTQSGCIVWSRVLEASEYELVFDDGVTRIVTSNTYLNLQNYSDISAGSHTVKIRAIGDPKNTIASSFASKDGEVINCAFQKPAQVSTLKIVDGKIKWTYENPNNDPNKNIGIDIYSSTAKLVTYVLVDERNRYYSAIKFDDLDFAENITYSYSKLIERLKSNECDIPDGLNGTTTLRLFAVPLNSYLSTQGVVSVDDDYKLVFSNFSQNLNILALKTPLNAKIENKRISWSPVLYNKTNESLPVKSYEVTIKLTSTKEDFVFYVKQDSTKTYQIDSANKTIWVNDITNSEYCYWDFTKENFANFFGEDKYEINTYSISVKSIANTDSTYTDDSGKVYYYCNSHPTTSLSVEVLGNPILMVENGQIIWSKVLNVSEYHIYISRTPNITENDNYRTLSAETINFNLLESDPAGEYYFNIQSIGNGADVFTAEFDATNEKHFIKLDTVTGLRLENGVIKYNENSVVGSGDDIGTCHYSVIIRETTQLETDDKRFNNAKNLTFELGDEFEGGKSYMIRVQAIGDSECYLNSNISDYCHTNGGAYEYPVKLATPRRVYVADGNLAWYAVYAQTDKLYYRISISGADFEQKTQFNWFDISPFITEGTYEVRLKVLGDSIQYLNSSLTSPKNIIKLSDLTNVKLEDGKLSWDYVSGSNYVAIVDGVEVELTSANSTIENGRIYYSLYGYNAGIYSVKVYNAGGSDNISSAIVGPYNLTKLGKSGNLSVGLVNGTDMLTYDSVENATKYFINLTAKFNDGTDDVTMLIKTIDGNNITSAVEFTKMTGLMSEYLTSLNIDSKPNTYVISVIAVGVTNDDLGGDDLFVSADNSDLITITKPDAPIIDQEFTSNGSFSGKITWTKVADADYYKVYIKASHIENAKPFGTYEKLESDPDHSEYQAYKVPSTRTYLNIQYNDIYSFIVVACKNTNGYNSDDSNLISNVSYSVFNSGIGTEDAPYIINNIYQFNCIMHNVSACYKLDVDLSIETTQNTFQKINDSFVGLLDGNNKTIQVVVDYDNEIFTGIFDSIGVAGIVKNLNLDVQIHSVAKSYRLDTQSNAIQVATIARENYGKIENVSVSGELSSIYQLQNYSYVIYNGGIVVTNYGTITYALSTLSILPESINQPVFVGGIAVENYGTIEKSGFRGIARGQWIGGITATNYGYISECYYEADDNIATSISGGNAFLTDGYIGGLVGYMDGGTIISSYVNGKVNGSSNNGNVYVGGMVGFVQNQDGIKESYVIGYKNSSLITATSIGGSAYLGVIVGGYNNAKRLNNVVCVKQDTQNFLGRAIGGTTSIADSVNIDNIRLSLGNSSANFSDNLKLKNAKYL